MIFPALANNGAIRPALASSSGGTPVYLLDIDNLASSNFKMRKRRGNGPFSYALYSTTNMAATAEGDRIQIAKGTAIKDNFHPTIDMYQGTFVVWITPEWDGDDGLRHVLLALDSSNYVAKEADNKLCIRWGGSGQEVGVDVSSWTAGTTYCVIARYDTNNTLDGTNYLCISVDDAHTFGRSSALTKRSAGSWNIGVSYSGQISVNGLIEGLTHYRYPLFDGTNGKNMGDGDVMAQIYNSGSGKDPTEITGSWGVCLCVPTNSASGELTTGTGEAWSHPYATAESNQADTFMQTPFATPAAWVATGSPSVGPADSSTAEKVYQSGGYTWTCAGDGDGIVQHHTSLTPGDTYIVRSEGHTAGSGYRLRAYDVTNGADIGLLVVGASSTVNSPAPAQFSFELPSGCVAMDISIEGTAVGDVIYAHLCELHVNEFNNPSFEGTYDTESPGIDIAPGWSNYTVNGTTAKETTIVHSGLASQKIVTAFSIDQIGDDAATMTFAGFKAFGFFAYSAATDTVSISSKNQAAVKTNAGGSGIIQKTLAADTWTMVTGVFGDTVSSSAAAAIGSGYSGGVTMYCDDAWVFPMDEIPILTATAANPTKSIESGGIRIDGGDYIFGTLPTQNMRKSGIIKFNVRPRHSSANMLQFDEGGVSYCHLYHASNKVTLTISGIYMYLSIQVNSVSYTAWWEHTIFVADTEYAFVIEYHAGGGVATLKIDGVTRITTPTITEATMTGDFTVMVFGALANVVEQADAIFLNP